ncbi:RAMP superfamily CRISPR-associated protein [Blautia sp. JLR.GB0024]|uniref:RAMP superfamily CRISPR-associated protein n=1 Tax=Blautia sp. JLR.GB0024 TaxID=3123295 RepID=UPI0030053452
MDQPGYIPETGKIKKWRSSENFDVLLDIPYEVCELEKSRLLNLFEILGFDEEIFGRAGLVTDEEFLYFVRYGTELTARIHVEKGSLFTEEYLPENIILYGVADKFKDLLYPLKPPILVEMLKNNSFDLQIGKNRTLGKGRIHFREIIPENIRGEMNG